MVVASQGSFFPTRLKKVATFVAIVWTIAASFVAFELVSVRGTDLMLSYPALFGNLLLSRATKQSSACAVQPGERTRRTTGRLSAAETRLGPWLLGLKIGRDGVARYSPTVDPKILAAEVKSMEQLAGMLGVPMPSVFIARQLASTNTEFIAFIEADAQGTAHQLAVAFSPQSCQIYKLAAFWGYATYVRFALTGDRALFAAEIRHYATQAGLPEPLWRPMIDRTPRDATAKQIFADTMAMTEGVAKYLVGQ